MYCDRARDLITGTTNFTKSLPFLKTLGVVKRQNKAPHACPCMRSAHLALGELLEELKTLPDTYNEDSLVKRMQDMGQHRLSMDHAKRIRTHIPDIVRHTHRTIAALIAQLSPYVQECLRAGLPIQTIEDALDRKLQEANYAFASKD